MADVTSIETGTEKVRLDFPAESVARLTISNPPKRNALDHEILDAITATVPRLDSGIEIRCLLITGEDPVFSAGYDIGDIPAESFEQDAEALVAHPFTAALDAIEAFPWPTVAALNGHCLGGALEMAVTCDLRVSAPKAKVGMPPAKLGLIYGHTGLIRFIRTIGLPRTRELFFTGDMLTAARADEIGLVNRVFEEDFEEQSVSFAAGIAANAPLSMKGNKQAIGTITENPVLSEKQIAELVALRESCFTSQDFLEGITAFGEKRKPNWTGR
ncbi:MAG: enoyl-CoA hydratase/isomerase family protein [Solirubrobacterales bacterium]|nr:enoyl-CoA hydratase/isomerase family protein [Solirubrobacterales bacterium]MCB0860541.1 enoyl-CoA hydratase/isomerase family protein [Solirubrobacterales bacterium]